MNRVVVERAELYRTRVVARSLGQPPQPVLQRVLMDEEPPRRFGDGALALIIELEHRYVGGYLLRRTVAEYPSDIFGLDGVGNLAEKNLHVETTVKARLLRR